ncbi:MAG: CapA family protein [Clostridiaceae bacterium]|nr:CapA family protein [Clostridiaceae bacterium]
MKIIISGDLCPTEQVMPFFINGNVDALFGDVPEVFSTADRVIVNLECALTTADTPIKKFGPNLKAVPECAKVLRNIGVTDCSLSNNHIFDFGIKGLQDTIKHLNDNGLLWTGVGENDTDSRRPHVMKVGSKTITVIAVCEHEYTYALPDRMGANPYDPYYTMEDIRAAKAVSDYVIVLYHGGKEHCRYPSPRLHKLCRAMVRNGADVVLCQHSHCIGCYENYQNGHILYGQGNFHFVKYINDECWQNGLIVELNIDEDNNTPLKITFIPVVTTETGITLAKGNEKDAILQAFEQRNEELKNGHWIKGWEQFCDSVKQTYLSVIANAYTENSTERQNHHFAHYLDCEAHTDVWRELNKTWNHTNEKNL